MDKQPASVALSYENSTWAGRFCQRGGFQFEPVWIILWVCEGVKLASFVERSSLRCSTRAEDTWRRARLFLTKTWLFGRRGFPQNFGFGPLITLVMVCSGPSRWSRQGRVRLPCTSGYCCSSDLRLLHILMCHATVIVLIHHVIFGYRPTIISYPKATSVFYEDIYFSSLLFIYGVSGCGVAIWICKYKHLLTWAYLCQARPSLEQHVNWAKSCGVYTSLKYLFDGDDWSETGNRLTR